MNNPKIEVPEVDENEDKSSEEALRVAHERFKLAEDAEVEIRKEALDDLEFRAGKQWPEQVKNERAQDNRPCLVINRVPQFIRQITNDQRQNRPSIKVFPVDDRADVETAKILQGIIRHIEYNSSADTAYDSAFSSAVTGGFGYFRIITEFESEMSFNQEILIKRIRNPFQVYLDPYHKEPDGSDANWAFIFEDISKDEYKALYKDSELTKEGDWESIGAQAPGWASENSCRIAEYFYKDLKDVEIVLLSNGEVIKKEDFAEGVIGQDGQPITVVQERVTQIPVIKWCKINAREILEETEWLGKWIPIIPVYGDELDVNGKRILESVVRHAKDSQRMYNYWASTETETIALAPRAPFIVAEGQITPNNKASWASANRKNYPYLEYKPTTLGGQPVAPPQRNVYEAPIQAITMARGQASEDLKATTGIYDASLGARANETSGVAIQRRNQQAQTSNFHFIDNLTRSLRHAGRILVDLIPKVYDTARTARIIGEDNEQKIVVINQLFEEHGQKKAFNLGAGKYDVAVETGPSYATKRQEALASMLDLTRAAPQIASLAMDLMVKNMDWPGASEIAERLKKGLPPGIADDPNNPQGKQIPPEVQAEMGQMEQMIQALSQQLSQAKEAMKNKVMELESKERIETMKIEADLKKELIKIQGSAAQTVLEEEIADINRRQAQLGYFEEFQDQDLNGPGPVAESPEQQQPTGGFPPGLNVEE